MVSKLSRKQLGEALETVPIEHVLGKTVSKGLTAKQKRFALEVAKGATKASAYRAAYDVTSKATMTSKPYELARDGRIQAEIAAYETAIEAAKYRTPAALRELVIQSLVSVVINPETKDSVKVAAAKVLGTVTEVAAFTERKEVRTIKSSDDAKAQVLNQIRSIMREQATDASVIEADADSLLAEIAGTPDKTPEGTTHPPGTPPSAAQESPSSIHTIPPEQSVSSPDSIRFPSDSASDTPTPSKTWDDGSLSDKGNTPP